MGYQRDILYTLVLNDHGIASTWEDQRTRPWKKHFDPDMISAWTAISPYLIYPIPALAYTFTPLIFIIAVDILLIKITSSRHIKGITLENKEEIRAQTFADDTSLLIQRCIISLLACVRYIEHFSKLSGLNAILDKTKVIPFGNNCNIKDKIGNHLPLEWEKEFTLLGLEIDNRLEQLDCNFDRVHRKTLSLINDWRARKLPI